MYGPPQKGEFYLRHPVCYFGMNLSKIIGVNLAQHFNNQTNCLVKKYSLQNIFKKS